MLPGYGMVFDPEVDSAQTLQSTLLATRISIISPDTDIVMCLIFSTRLPNVAYMLIGQCTSNARIHMYEYVQIMCIQQYTADVQIFTLI